jgi:sugar phosphate isomerase/epimerase
MLPPEECPRDFVWEVLMKPSLITDEISSDPETAFELGREWGIRDFELRGYFTDRAPMLSPYQKRRLREMVTGYGVNIFALSPGLFKMPYPLADPACSNLGWMDRAFFDAWSSARSAVDFHLNELLPASLDYANELGAQLVICFSFHRGGRAAGAPPDEVLECLSRAAERARQAGLTLAVETEEGFWADTGARSAEIVRKINHAALGINWDPANSFCEGDVPFPDGYAAVRGLVLNVHFKDARRRPDGAAEFVLEGEVNWAGQIAALQRDGYRGFISIEPHLRPRIASVRTSLERLRVLIADRDAQPSQRSKFTATN